MSLDCERWVVLADREAVGDALQPEERAFQRTHEGSCEACAREAAIWRALRLPEPDVVPDTREVDRILALASGRPASRLVAMPGRWRRTALVASAAACAAALLFWWTGRREQPEGGARLLARATSTIGSSLRRIPTARAVPVAPVVEQNAQPHCSEAIPGAIVCLSGGAVIASQQLDSPDRAIEVGRGRAVVSLAPQPAGTSFSLSTAAGKVTAVGTIFSVEIAPDGSTIARVIEGHVLVRAGDAPAQSLRAGQALRVGEQQPRPLSDQERDQDLELLSLSGAQEGEPSNAPSGTTPAEARGGAAPQDLLKYARSLRASGDFRRAADVYRKIYAQSPQSPSGRAALVSLGELLLSLNDPQGALGAFDSYLSGGGTLAQEATFGRARALRALNRPADERRAIERFIASYPSAPQTRVLRARLAAMQK